MPQEALTLLIVFSLIIIPAIVFSVVAFKNVRQHTSKNLDGHFVEIHTGFKFAKLVIDSKTVDEVRSFQIHTAKLQGKIGETEIIVNIGSGFLKPKILTFINGEKDSELSNS